MTTIEDGLDRQVDRPPTRRRHRTTPPPRLAGVEHEYTLAIGAQRVDARRRVDLRGVARPALDPADPNARRLPWGGVVTYDGPELEVVTPPVTIRPGFAGDLAAAAARGRRDLEAVLQAGATIDGFSTHLNVSVTPGSERAVARLFLTHFAAPTMLLLDDAGSPGLLVRPRPGRLEVGGEFASGPALVAALVFVAGAARCCEAVAARRFGRARRAQAGRSDPEPRVGDPTRPDRGARIDATLAPLALVDDLVAGGAKLPCERPAERPAQAAATDAPASPPAPASGERPALPALAGPAAGDAPVEAEVPVDGHDPRSASPFGALIRPRVRGPLTITAEVVTWRFAVFEVTDGTARCHRTVPGTELEAFLHHVDAGLLDDELGEQLRRPRRARLARPSQTDTSAAYRDLGDPSSLLPPERDAGTGRLLRGAGGGGLSGNRPGKRQQHEAPHSTPRPWRRSLVLAGVAVVAAVVLAAAAFAVLGKDDPTPAAASATSTTTGRATDTPGSADADLGDWESTAGTIALRREGDQLIGVVTAVSPAIVPGCELRVGDQLFAVKAVPPSTVDTLPAYRPRDEPFVGRGTVRVLPYQRNADGAIVGCSPARDQAAYLLSGIEAIDLGDGILLPTLHLTTVPDLFNEPPSDAAFPMLYRFHATAAPQASSEPTDTGASTPSGPSGGDSAGTGVVQLHT